MPRPAGQGPSPDELGQRLRAAREARGISLRALAKRIEVSPSFISQVELGRASPSVGTLYALVNALELSLDDVMSDEAGTSREPGVSEPVADVEPTTGRGAGSAWRLPAADPSPEAAGPDEAASRHPHSHAPAVLPRDLPDPPGARPRIAQPVQRAAGRRVIKMSGVVWERLTHDDDPLVDFLYVTYAPGSASCQDDDMMRHSGREYGHVVSGRIDVQVGFETYRLEPGDSIHFDSASPHRLSNPFDEPCVAVWVVVGRRGDPAVAPAATLLPSADDAP